MDLLTLMVATAISKGIPGTAGAQATAAAEDAAESALSAAESAVVAATHNYGISVDENNRLIITAPVT